jgi:predicted nuclease with TOPRIM domain
MTKNFRDWFTEGESIYTEAIKEYESLQAQIEELEARLESKREEVNQVAQMLGKPPVEGSRKVTAQLVEHQPPPPVIGSIARALSGRGAPAR